MSTLARSITMPVIALVVALTTAGPAMAAPRADAVPGDVVRYIADGLVDDLDEFYGPGIDDSGIDFTDAVPAPAVRIFGFTDEFLAGDADSPDTRRLNEWITVIAIDKTPVGVAIVSIDPVTVSAQLSSFTASAEFGAVIAGLSETARLIHDVDRSAWFSLDEAQLTPIVSGTSHITEPIALADYRRIVAAWPAADAAEAEPSTEPGGGLILAGLALLLIVLLVAVEAFLPSWRRRAKELAAATETVEEAEAG